MLNRDNLHTLGQYIQNVKTQRIAFVEGIFGNPLDFVTARYLDDLNGSQVYIEKNLLQWQIVFPDKLHPIDID